MVYMNQVEVAQSYSICESKTVIEGETYCDYGIALSTINDGKLATIAKVEGISTEKAVVSELLNRLSDEALDQETLQYIAEDYIGEISSIYH